MVKQIVFICGLSGVGKSFIAKKFIERNPNFYWLDQDSFYKAEKPTVQLSNGQIVSNWDCPEALDWDKFNTSVTELNHEKIIITGFAPLRDRIKFEIGLLVELYYTGSMKATVKRCIEMRRESKGFTTEEKLKKDELMIREVTVPFYVETMKKNIPDVIIPAFNQDNSRRDISGVLEDLELWIEEFFGNSVYIAYYFNRKNSPEIYGVFKKKKDAVRKVKIRALEDFGLNSELYGTELIDNEDKDICYWLSFEKGEKNFIVEKKAIY